MPNMCVSYAAESGEKGRRIPENADPEPCFGFAAVWRAYLACRRGKRGTANTQRYELRLLDHIVDTSSALQSRNYVPSRSICFVVKQPKAREIHAADFSDRVVHHLLVPHLEAQFEPVFIHDLYSNRKGKGTHAAVERLSGFMRSLEGQQQGTVYALQLDVRNFFNTIDRRILLGLVEQRLRRSVRNEQLLRHHAAKLYWLTRRLLGRCPTDHVIERGPPKAFARVPSYKRLANAPEGVGLPIGNLTSQFFANVYLNELDQYIKHQLKCRHYLRYVDDFVLLSYDPDQLMAWRDAIVSFLHQHLALELKALNEPRPISNGIDFLGYIIRPHYRLVRRRVVDNVRQRLQGFEMRMFKQKGGDCTLLLRRDEREALRATLASYLGHFRHANAVRLVDSLWQRYPWLAPLFQCRADYRLRPLWEPASVTSLRSQWHYFKQMHPTMVCLMQVGNRVELYGRDAQYLATLLGGGVTTERHGFEQAFSVPFHRLAGARQLLHYHSTPHLLVVEEGYLRGGMKRRVLAWLWWPESPFNDLNRSGET